MKKSTNAGCWIAAGVIGVALGLAGVVPSVAQAALDNATLPKMSTPLKDVTLVIFDVETTGFSAEKDRVVELGAVKFRNGVILATTNWLIHPGRAIPKRVTKVHGITDEMVKDKPAFTDVYPEFLAFIGDALLVAHNARFDVDFVRAEINRAGLPLPSNAVIDSLKLFRRWYPESTSHKISVLTDYIGLSATGLHRGNVDAEYTGQIFLEGLNRHPKVRTLRQLLADSGGLLVF